ncbi:carboxypeptidase-like regulatory domain-containing protein [Pedobacter sp. SD-b]|uniref:Carboxypeptidase-like regulatory domain-containing protein n=1 Tax=Pedobacter segetis TaxID=2793069 RepID=A0ABS1BJM2_9SPHI|nr:carboxypeptidase-like regulatory domain-containing protein [Pedobacter segetis]MBK0383084.1 carboxypeptidase-like regulatory domain-containing protein [Pedobacter segetis]
MIKKVSDIELIRKYLNGQLSPAEMNSLEARALDDPFLQDALDGFSEFGLKDPDMNDLNYRLNEKLSKKEKIIGLNWGVKQWGIAASIILALTLSAIYFNQTPNNKNIALADLQKAKQIPDDEKIKTDTPTNNDKGQNNYPEIENDKKEQQIAILNDTEYPETKKAFSPGTGITLEQKETMADANMDSDEAAAAPTLEKEKIAAISAKQENLMAARSMKSAIAAPQTINIKGRVIDEKDSAAIPGVSIRNLATGNVTQTDAHGEFDIEAPKNSKLAISYIGYETITKSIENDSLNIALKQDKSQLSEVVVVGYGTPKSNENLIAGPKKGWATFRKYLDDEAKKADLNGGEVQIEFVIQADGKLTDFKVLKSFNAIADEKAVNLVKDFSGGWNGSADKTPQKASVTVKF